MRKSLFPLITFLIIYCLFPSLSFARTGYVSDMLLLTFREGPGNSYAVIKTLKSDTPVSIIEEQDDFYKVELESKETGWVDKRFIVFETPKTAVIDALEQENKRLENKIADLEEVTRALQDQIAVAEEGAAEKIRSLETALTESLDEKTKISNSLSDNREKYDTLIEQSQNIQTIVKENKLLQEKTAVISKELEIYKGKNKNVFKTGMIKWFLAGVGVLLLGWIIGHSVSSRKKRSGSSLLS